MSRLIDADALIERISREVITYTGGRNLYTVGLETAELFALEATTIETEPVKGAWEIAIGCDPRRAFMCDQCYKMAFEATPYCPHCGARIDNWEELRALQMEVKE